MAFAAACLLRVGGAARRHLPPQRRHPMWPGGGQAPDQANKGGQAGAGNAGGQVIRKTRRQTVGHATSHPTLPDTNLAVPAQNRDRYLRPILTDTLMAQRELCGTDLQSALRAPSHVCARASVGGSYGRCQKMVSHPTLTIRAARFGTPRAAEIAKCVARGARGLALHRRLIMRQLLG
jgi:hypothetical protein